MKKQIRIIVNVIFILAAFVVAWYIGEFAAYLIFGSKK